MKKLKNIYTCINEENLYFIFLSKKNNNSIFCIQILSNIAIYSVFKLV